MKKNRMKKVTITSQKIAEQFEKNSDKLTEKERDIIARYYSLGFTRHSLQEIANIYKVTRERIRQIKTIALFKLAIADEK